MQCCADVTAGEAVSHGLGAHAEQTAQPTSEPGAGTGGQTDPDTQATTAEFQQANPDLYRDTGVHERNAVSVLTSCMASMHTPHMSCSRMPKCDLIVFQRIQAEIWISSHRWAGCTEVRAWARRCGQLMHAAVWDAGGCRRCGRSRRARDRRRAC